MEKDSLASNLAPELDLLLPDNRQGKRPIVLHPRQFMSLASALAPTSGSQE